MSAAVDTTTTPSLREMESVIVRVCTAKERDALALREAGDSTPDEL